MPSGTGSITTADQVILNALADGPLSTREISERILLSALHEWSALHGYDIEWKVPRPVREFATMEEAENAEPPDDEPLGARLLALGEARDCGLALHPWEIAPRLHRLEKHGHVTRIQIQGRRPMLWRLASSLSVPVPQPQREERDDRS